VVRRDMFTQRIKEIDKGVKHCVMRLGKVDAGENKPQAFAPLDISQIPYWRRRLEVYREARDILSELQELYDQKRGKWRKWLHIHINGTDRMGFELLATTRLAPIEKRVPKATYLRYLFGV
jgi:hypothetical protein